MIILEVTGPFMLSFKSDAMTFWHIIKVWGNNNKAIASHLNTQKTSKNGCIVYFNLTCTLHGITPTQTQVIKIEGKLK